MEDEIHSWLIRLVADVTNGPLVYFSTDLTMSGPPLGMLVVDESSSPSPRTLGDLFALPTRQYGKHYRDRFVAVFGEKSLSAVNESAPLEHPEEWLQGG